MKFVVEIVGVKADKEGVLAVAKELRNIAFVLASDGKKESSLYGDKGIIIGAYYWGS